MSKTYKLEDFFSTSSKLSLKDGDKDTGHHLMIKSANDSSLVRHKIAYGIAINEINEKLGGLEDKIERAELIMIQKGDLDADLAMAMVESTSFDNMSIADLRRLIEDNSLAEAIHAKSYEMAGDINLK